MSSLYRFDFSTTPIGIYEWDEDTGAWRVEALSLNESLTRGSNGSVTLIKTYSTYKKISTFSQTATLFDDSSYYTEVSEVYTTLAGVPLGYDPEDEEEDDDDGIEDDQDDDGSNDDLISCTSGNDFRRGGSGDDDIYGLLGNDDLRGDQGDDCLNGGDGKDSLFGGIGYDALSGDAGDDKLKGEENNDLLRGGAGSDDLDGGSGNDDLDGGLGDDILNGGTGADRMRGGTGNDNYLVDNIGDSVIEELGTNNGIDLVRASITCTISDPDVENLTLIGSSAINGTGNGSSNTLRGNSAANSLNGGNGNDDIHGGGGKDFLTGSTGIDKFRYSSISESGVGAALRDSIMDFQGGLGERIDLSAIDAYTNLLGNQAFSYIGSAGFTGTRGEVRYALGVLQINTGIDKVADMEIQLNGTTGFQANFLIL